jgi:hypothetical protein
MLKKWRDFVPKWHKCFSPDGNYMDDVKKVHFSIWPVGSAFDRRSQSRTNPWRRSRVNVYFLIYILPHWQKKNQS